MSRSQSRVVENCPMPSLSSLSVNEPGTGEGGAARVMLAVVAWTSPFIVVMAPGSVDWNVKPLSNLTDHELMSDTASWPMCPSVVIVPVTVCPFWSNG